MHQTLKSLNKNHQRETQIPHPIWNDREVTRRERRVFEIIYDDDDPIVITRRENDISSIKMNIHPFQGKKDLNAYNEWESKVDLLSCFIGGYLGTKKLRVHLKSILKFVLTMFWKIKLKFC